MDLCGIVSIEMVRTKDSQLLLGFFFFSLSFFQSFQCFPINIEIRGTLERILLEAIMREKMKKEKEIEVPTSPRGQQDKEHVIMYYTINMKRRGKFHAEPESKRKM